MWADKKIGVGIVGLSAERGWAAAAHMPALAKLPEFEVRGLVGSSKEKAAAAAKKFQVPFFTNSLRELVVRPEIDLVVVAVKVPDHFAPVMAALEAGKMVFCEWPLGQDTAEALAMAAFAESKSLRTFVGLQARNSPIVRYVRDLVKGGYLGGFLSTNILAAGGAPWGGPISRNQVFYQKRESGATMFSIPFAHAFDALCAIFGELENGVTRLAVRQKHLPLLETDELVEVTAPDQVVYCGSFPDGALASLHYRAGSPGGTRFHWEINGTNGDLLITGKGGHLQFGQVEIKGAAHGEETMSPIQIPDSYSKVDILPSSLACTVAHAYKAMAADIRDNTFSVPSFADAVLRHRSLDAMEKVSGSV